MVAVEEREGDGPGWQDRMDPFWRVAEELPGVYPQLFKTES
jgi:hypothetical protein